MTKDPTWQELFTEWEQSESPAVMRMIKRCKDLEGCLNSIGCCCNHILYPRGSDRPLCKICAVIKKKPSEYGEME